MVGGEKSVFDACLPILQAMGKNIVHAGPSGMGQTFKLCNQVVAALNIMSMCEGLLLAAKAGADLGAMIQAVSAGAAGSWMMTNLAPKVAARDYAPGFFVRLQQKDLRLVLELARELDLPMPGVALVSQLFRAVEASGEGELGTQALIKAYERLAGIQVGDTP
jgi:3-hydroxyisobutyrate dehydrogenase-like beta-hydroxyacid dehydrogenase